MHVTIFIFIFFPLFSYLYRLVAPRGIEENIFLGFQLKKSICWPVCVFLTFSIWELLVLKVKTQQYKVKKSLPPLFSLVPFPRGKQSVGFLLAISREGGEYFLIWFFTIDLYKLFIY